MKWTKEKIVSIAKKYKKMADFMENDHPAYVAAQKRNMLYNELDFLERTFKYSPKGYWTKEKALEESKKYNRLVDLSHSNKGLYERMRIKGWLKDAYWLERSVNKVGYWTKEKIIEESKKYNTKAEFKFYSQVAYVKAREMKLFEEMPWFKIKDVSNVKDCIYGYFFEEFKTAYIGRTIERRIKIRDKEHRKGGNNDSVYKFAIKNNVSIPEIKIIESGLTVFDGSERERYWEQFFKDNGYKTLNVAKCGSLGSLLSGKWNKETITKEAKKYNTRSKFKKGNQSAYYASIRLDLLDSFDWLPPRNSVRKGYWTIKENVIEESKKYKCKWHFQKNCSAGYIQAKKNKWLDEMIWLNGKKENKKQY